MGPYRACVRACVRACLSLCAGAVQVEAGRREESRRQQTGQSLLSWLRAQHARAIPSHPIPSHTIPLEPDVTADPQPSSTRPFQTQTLENAVLYSKSIALQYGWHFVVTIKAKAQGEAYHGMAWHTRASLTDKRGGIRGCRGNLREKYKASTSTRLVGWFIQ